MTHRDGCTGAVLQVWTTSRPPAFYTLVYKDWVATMSNAKLSYPYNINITITRLDNGALIQTWDGTITTGDRIK